jgi:glycerol-3-phosphate O-acyltransferase
MNNKEKGPLILIPTHRSYIDFVLVSYIFFHYKMKLPHIAAVEEFLHVYFLNNLMRLCGAFFLKRNCEKDELY